MISYNGEVYNFKELKARFGAGHTFKTNSDTEVILHLYEDFGIEGVQHLRGMFALAIWDERNRTLLLARDRIGIKPLFYTFADNTLLFASEIKAILQHKASSRSIDLEALQSFLSFGYVSSGDRTMFVGINKLPPGGLLLCLDGKIKLSRYWSLPEPLAEEGWTGHSRGLMAFRNELKPMMADCLLSARARERGYFDHSFVKTMIDCHINGTKDYGHYLWVLLLLEWWFQTFADE